MFVQWSSNKIFERIRRRSDSTGWCSHHAKNLGTIFSVAFLAALLGHNWIPTLTIIVLEWAMLGSSHTIASDTTVPVHRLVWNNNDNGSKFVKWDIAEGTDPDTTLLCNWREAREVHSRPSEVVEMGTEQQNLLVAMWPSRFVRRPISVAKCRFEIVCQQDDLILYWFSHS